MQKFIRVVLDDRGYKVLTHEGQFVSVHPQRHLAVREAQVLCDILAAIGKGVVWSIDCRTPLGGSC